MSTRILAILLTAQDEEVQPILDLLTERSTRPIKQASPVGEVWLAHSTRGSILVVQTGVGMVQTGCTLSWALTNYTPKVVISTGAAGGLGHNVKVGDVVIGSTYMYANADGTAFDYTYGQVPGQPEYFTGFSTLLNNTPNNAHVGLMLSSDSFVTATNATEVREHFPQALSTDMESTAAAQTCHCWGIPFLSVRCISDLCSPDSVDVYNEHLDNAGITSARIALEMLTVLENAPTGGPSQRFSRDALTAALLLVFARVKNLPLGDPNTVPEPLIGAVVANFSEAPANLLGHVLARIAAARDAIGQDPSLTMTASQYDKQRKETITELGLDTGRGQLSWPPTSQTIIKRSGGYWNEALAAIGLRVQSGRKRGGLRFNDKAYIDALRTFAAWCARNNIQPSYMMYSEWIKRTSKKGKVPSGAAIRQRYGSWSAATEAAHI